MFRAAKRTLYKCPFFVLYRPDVMCKANVELFFFIYMTLHRGVCALKKVDEKKTAHKVP